MKVHDPLFDLVVGCGVFEELGEVGGDEFL